jgi:hypothetical protein
VFQFLASLDSSYEALRSQLILGETLASFNIVANMVQREESKRFVMNTWPHEPEETKTFIICYLTLTSALSIEETLYSSNVNIASKRDISRKSVDSSIQNSDRCDRVRWSK